MTERKEGGEMSRRILTVLTLAFALAGLVVAVPLATGSQSQQSVIRDKLGEIGAWAVPSTPNSTPNRSPTEHSQQAYLVDKLGEIGAWAVPATPSQQPLYSEQATILDKLGEIGAWAVPMTSTPG
jgi:hypothetical protein